MTALPAPVLAILFILGACAGALAIYAVARTFLARYADDDTVSLAGSVIFRVAALHGLILARISHSVAVRHRGAACRSARRAPKSVAVSYG